MVRSALEILIQESSQVGEARRISSQLAKSAGFSEVDATSFTIIVSELATNILKHAKSGSIVLGADDNSVEVLALDKGPGIENISQAMQDGFSTTGTAGNGLGAIRRLSTESDFYSVPNQGLIVYAKIEKSIETSKPFRLVGFSIPYPGETVSGDSWNCSAEDQGLSIAIADGLGHGLLASEASNAAISQFLKKPFIPPAKQLEGLHKVLRGTRGAAMSIAHMNFESHTVQYCGVGNVALAETSEDKSRRMVSYEGTLGLQVRRFQELTYPYPDDALFIMHSDGIATSWDLAKYPTLKRKHPGVIAGLLLRDFRKKDDATVVVARMRELTK